MSFELTDLNLKSTLHFCTLSLSNDSATVAEDISVLVVETGISANNFSNTHATSCLELVKSLSIFYLNSKLRSLAFAVSFRLFYILGI